MKEIETNLKELVVTLTCAIDLMSFFIKNHHQRVAVISYKLGTALGLEEKALKSLVLAASLHDIGAKSIKERDALVQMDIEDPHEHAELGARMLETFPYFQSITPIIKNHHQYWKHGEGAKHEGKVIPMECFILHLADRIDILINPDNWILDEKVKVREKIEEYRDIMFKPEIVDCFLEISSNDNFWLDINFISLDTLLNDVLQEEESIIMDGDTLQLFALTMSHIIDYRSSHTAAHSAGVGAVAYAIAELAGMDLRTQKQLRIAGYLHDFGKVAIPSEIIDKQGKLSINEKSVMRAHSYYSGKILNSIHGISEISNLTLLHHERPDGTGYPFGLKADGLNKEIEVLIISDVFTSLRENRAYREAMDFQGALKLIKEELAYESMKDLVDLVIENFEMLDNLRERKQSEARNYFSHQEM